MYVLLDTNKVSIMYVSIQTLSITKEKKQDTTDKF